MGGDLGPREVIYGIAECSKINPDFNFIVHGNYAQLSKLIKNTGIQNKCEIVDAKKVVSMDQKPSQVIRHGQETSMWSAIESVKTGKANACVSGGNTGALMALSVIRLRKSPGVNRPAIACLWPSKNNSGFNIVLDVGADIRADRNDLLQYAIMGSRYAKQGFDMLKPRVGLLNVGTEEHKGSAELKEAYDLIKRNSKIEEYKFVGFVEGGDIPANSVDIIVTDGFTGNVALKTAEGTANFITSELKKNMTKNLLGKISTLINYKNLNSFKKKFDPRLYNGAILLGLDSAVVKSHGATDSVGFFHSLNVCEKIVKGKLIDKIKQSII